jgi:hypothetical protein
MPARLTEKQEARSERLSLAVTEFESLAVATVAQARGKRAGRKGEGYATLLRDMSLQQIVREYKRLCSVMDNARSEAA